jgi:hypothetical protein
MEEYRQSNSDLRTTKRCCRRPLVLNESGELTGILITDGEGLEHMPILASLD